MMQTMREHRSVGATPGGALHPSDSAPGKRAFSDAIPAGDSVMVPIGALMSEQAAPIQAKRDLGSRPDPAEARDDPFGLHLGAGAALPSPVQAKMEQSFGVELSSVRVHQGSEAGAMGAQAFTQGTDIHFAPGRYDPHGAEGQELLGHELAHVVQQSQGRVTSTTQAKGAAVNDDPALEREADEMGARAARGEPAGVQIGGLRANAGVRQLKREPISAAGKQIVALAKQFFALATDQATDKVVLTNLAAQITTAAGLLDVGKETNEDFLYVMKIFKAGLHATDAELLRVKVEEKFTFLTDEITAEGTQETAAKQRELAEGGHALERHGPQVSDDALIRRLHTGIAPDGVLVPAPGASSRFNSFTDVMATRQKGAALLQQEIATAAGKVLTWLGSVGGLTNVHTLAHQDTAAKGLALTTATTEKTDAYKPTSGLDKSQKEAKLNAFKQAGTDKKAAEGAEKTAKDEMDHPGKNLKRVLPGLTKVKLTIDDDVSDAASLEDGVELAESYGIYAEHGRPIGTAFVSGDSIKLSDLLPKVSDGDPPVPKAAPDITLALQADGFAGDIPRLRRVPEPPGQPARREEAGRKGRQDLHHRGRRRAAVHELHPAQAWGDQQAVRQRRAAAGHRHRRLGRDPALPGAAGLGRRRRSLIDHDDHLGASPRGRERGAGQAEVEQGGRRPRAVADLDRPAARRAELGQRGARAGHGDRAARPDGGERGRGC